ncbi:MAG: hypothetical protein KBT48_09580 [Firmicutes bacterium]|nr:hypothetical protein [Bacillota bacterium]
MNEIQEMNKKITKYTILFSVAGMVIGTIVFHDIKVPIGLLVGAVTGLIGYYMIVDLAVHIPEDEEVGKKKGISNYYLRYLLYAFVFAAGVFLLKLPILSLLVGILIHKASIYAYSIIEKRKGG